MSTTEETLITPSPGKAISPLGKILAYLLRETGLQIDIDEFGEIDEIAKTLKSLQSQIIEVDRHLDSVDSKAEEAESMAADGDAALKNLEGRVDQLSKDFSNLYDSIPIADRPALDSQTFSSGNDNDDDDGSDDPFCS
jgi:chromosome segregation ATPase